MIRKYLNHKRQTTPWPPDITENCKASTITCTVLPAKSDSDVMVCSQSYQGLRIVRINTQVSYRFAYAQVKCTRLCVNKVLRHCHSWLARQYNAHAMQIYMYYVCR